MTERQASPDGLAAASIAADQLVLTTEVVPERDRFDFYLEEIAGRHMKFDITKPEQLPFYGYLEASAAGEVFVSRVASSPASYQRSRSALADGDDSALLLLMRKGCARILQGSVDAVASDGMAFLFHAAMPGQIISPSKDNWAEILRVPGSALQHTLRAGQSPSPRVFAAADPAIGLLASYVTAFHNLPATANTALRSSMGSHFSDLVALAIGANQDAAELINGRGLKAARTEAVLKAIRESFARPDISAAMVGRALGITDRQVHRLLEETPKSFYEHVLECRLQEAHRQLCDPAALGLKVADIAFRAGFTDVTYFNRAFKTRFGDKPTGVRNGAARRYNTSRPDGIGSRAISLPHMRLDPT